MYAYIDESGDTGYTKKSTKYFILTAVIVDDPFVLRRIAKDIHKFKIDKKKNDMVHAYKESMVVKNKLVKKLSHLKYIKCKCFVFDKNKIKEKDLYMFGLDFLCKYFYKHKVDKIIIAKRDTRSYYNSQIIYLFNKSDIYACFSYPNVEKSLQIADFYSWSIFSHVEYGLSEYFLKLKQNIEIIDKTKPSRH